MSRISVAALALAFAALGFALGYYAGPWRHDPWETTALVRREGAPAPAPGSVSAAVEAALTEPDPLERTAQLARLLEGLGPESVGEVKAAFDAFFVDSGDLTIVLFAEWWARLDPRSAFDWASSEWTARHPAVLMSVMYAWAKRDPEEARRALDGIKSQTHRSACLEALLCGWADSGKPGLVDYLAVLPAGPDQQLSIALLARRKARRDGLEQTFRWAEGLPDDPERFKLNVFRRVASAATEVDPQRATAWAEQHSTGKYGRGLFRRVGVRWANRDGEAAMLWLATLPAGSERGVAVQETYRVWLSRDHERAMAWMREAELEPWLEPALLLFSLSLTRESFEEALEWAARLVDKERRREAEIKIARGWFQKDPEAAQAWLDQSGISDEDRKWIFNPPRAARGRRPAPRQADSPVQEDVPSLEAEEQ